MPINYYASLLHGQTSIRQVSRKWWNSSFQHVELILNFPGWFVLFMIFKLFLPRSRKQTSYLDLNADKRLGVSSLLTTLSFIILTEQCRNRELSEQMVAFMIWNDSTEILIEFCTIYVSNALPVIPALLQIKLFKPDKSQISSACELCHYATVRQGGMILVLRWQFCGYLWSFYCTLTLTAPR